jgi:hypothetical protein
MIIMMMMIMQIRTPATISERERDSAGHNGRGGDRIKRVDDNQDLEEGEKEEENRIVTKWRGKKNARLCAICILPPITVVHFVFASETAHVPAVLRSRTGSCSVGITSAARMMCRSYQTCLLLSKYGFLSFVPRCSSRH